MGPEGAVIWLSALGNSFTKSHSSKCILTHTHRLKFIFFVFIKEINFHCRCVGKPRKQNQPSPCFSFSCRGWEGEGYTLQGLEGEENAVSLKADALWCPRPARPWGSSHRPQGTRLFSAQELSLALVLADPPGICSRESLSLCPGQPGPTPSPLQLTATEHLKDRDQAFR